MVVSQKMVVILIKSEWVAAWANILIKTGLWLDNSVDPWGSTEAFHPLPSTRKPNPKSVVLGETYNIRLPAQDGFDSV